MTNQSQPVRLSVTSTTELLGVVPVVLGFHPVESLVLLVLDDGVLQVSARADLTDILAAGGGEALVERLWFQFPNADAVLVAYSASAELAWRALDAVADALPTGAIRHGLHATTDRYYCEPGGQGHPYDPRASVTAAQAVRAGEPVLPSRGALVEALKPRFARRELRRAASAAKRLGAAEAAERAERALAAGESDADACAIIALACAEPGFAEGVVWSVCRENARNLAGVWRGVASGVEPALAGPAIGVCSVASWVAGDGAMANVCLERALALRYWDAWLDLVDLAIVGAMHPRVWDDLRAAYLDDVGFHHDQVRGVR